MAMLTEYEVSARITAMDEMTPAELLTKGAEIIENDPWLASDCFIETFLVHKTTGEVCSASRIDNEEADNWTPRACHCLEGAVQEAAGIFYEDDNPGDWVKLVADPRITRHWDARHRTKINGFIVKAIPVDELKAMTDSYPRANVDDYDQTVYTYSDQVLSPKGRDGALEAAELLRRAAAIATKEG